MEFSDEAIVLTALPHGENGAVVRFLAMQGGLRSGYVQGARGRAKRALLSPGNRVAIRLRARSEGQLASADLEMVESRALIAFEPRPAVILEYLAALTAAALAEDVPHPRLATALDALLTGLQNGIGETDALGALARYELLLLEEEGFGLDLSSCALGGPNEGLAFVSPKSGRAVSREKAAGQPWERQLFPLPPFLLQGGQADAADVDRALTISGHFLRRHWLSGDKMERLRQRATEGTVGSRQRGP